MMEASDNINKKGVSLTELAIVIIIIGILIAVVTSGLKVRSASEIRGIISDIQGFQVAVESFDLKYEDLPGDMVDAHDYWDNGSNTVCGTASECNGNGDSEIDLTTSQNDNESFRAWQHLTLAGFIEGGYTGIGLSDGGTNDQAEPTTNVPSTSRMNGGYTLLYGNLNGTSRNEFRVSTFRQGEALGNSLLTPSEAYSIDKKLDDGNPTNGRVKGKEGADYTSTTNEQCQSSAGTSYLITTTDRTCQLSFPVNQ